MEKIKVGKAQHEARVELERQYVYRHGKRWEWNGKVFFNGLPGVPEYEYIEALTTNNKPKEK